MAARLNCQQCGNKQFFRDRETPTIYCARCRSRMKWHAEETAELDALEGVTLTQKDSDTVAKLVALAVDKGAADGESANAARAACKILAEKGAIALLRRPVRRGRGRK